MSDLIFFGSDQYSAVVLAQLLASAHQLLAVVTTQSKPQGRDQQVILNEVEKLANRQKIKVIYYPSKQAELDNFIITLKALKKEPFCGVVASFGRLIAPAIINFFPHGIINLHPSLLPQYRNVAPVPYAIAMGDQETGVTLFKINSEVDSGEILAQATTPILPTDTSPVLLNRLFLQGTALLLTWLSQPIPFSPPASPSQPLIFTRKLTRASGFLEWPTLLKLITDQPLLDSETANPLLNLRLTHHPERNHGLLLDLTRALTGWEKVWSVAPTKKGELTISLTYNFASSNFEVLIAGKPQPMPYSQFQQLYLL